ncbi:ABC transporter permease [Kitasatospora sp. NPDC059408]|uniref:ABC transporter permease n=1 Tax=Kitasatospora sp. NPDC059408 TaxID=3346823 RepID=UPI0036A26B60
MSLTRWLVRRLLLGVLVVLGAASAAFLALHLIPGDPARVALGGAVPPSDDAVERTRHELGLDRPLVTQYALFLGRLARGSLGDSYQLHQPVGRLIGDQLPSTVELALAGFTVAFLAAALLGIATAGRRPVWRRISATVELLLTSLPSFWIGILLLTAFSFQLHLFPAAGDGSPAALVLPALTLALGMVGVLAQVIRDGLTRALEQPFALSARARGTGETALRVRHAFRHALVSVTTLAGWVIGALLGGAVVIETVFSRPGLGRTLATAVESRDFPVVTGVVIVSGALFTLVNLLVDGLYQLIDPRLREARP